LESMLWLLRNIWKYSCVTILCQARNRKSSILRRTSTTCRSGREARKHSRTHTFSKQGGVTDSVANSSQKGRHNACTPWHSMSVGSTDGGRVEEVWYQSRLSNTIGRKQRQQGHLWSDVEVTCRVLQGRPKGKARLHSSRNGAAMADIVTNVLPAKFIIRYLAFFTDMHRFMTELAVRQIQTRSCIGVFPGKVQ
jgi:hypothetical protein